MPMAPPTERTALLSAEAAPALSLGMAAMTRSVVGAITRAEPAPRATSSNSTTAIGVSRSMVPGGQFLFDPAR